MNYEGELYRLNRRIRHAVRQIILNYQAENWRLFAIYADRFVQWKTEKQTIAAALEKTGKFRK